MVAPYTLFAGDLNSDSTAEQAGGAADTAVQQLREVPGLSELVPCVCVPVSLTFSTFNLCSIIVPRCRLQR